VDYANGTCLMVDREFFWELGGFDDWFRYFYEDVDFNLRAKKAGAQAWYGYRAVIYHKGSLSFKQNVAAETVVFYMRRNRLVTVMKNFRGLGGGVRLAGLVIMSVFMPRPWISVKAMVAAGKRWQLRAG
jgi:GT2 family glycosyltransferase